MWLWNVFFISWTVLCSEVTASAVHVPTIAKAKRFLKQKPFRARGGSVDVNPKLFKRFSDDSRMPSLFMPDESLFDRYAACLAATEGLRRIRDRDLADEARERGFMRGSELTNSEKEITTQYIKNSGKVLRALGMTVNQFNDLGKQIAQDTRLKERVMEQAYLYRMAATINMDRMPLLEDAATDAVFQAYRRDKVHLFSESLSEIEQLRNNQLERLKKSLRVDNMPGVNISDPGLLPFLNAKVRAVVEAFPLQAEEIVRKHGLDSEEFNKMLEETKTNPLFRWKVQKQIRDEKQGQSPEGGARRGADDNLTPDSFSQHRTSVRVNR